MSAFVSRQMRSLIETDAFCHDDVVGVHGGPCLRR